MPQLTSARPLRALRVRPAGVPARPLLRRGYRVTAAAATVACAAITPSPITPLPAS